MRTIRLSQPNELPINELRSLLRKKDITVPCWRCEDLHPGEEREAHDVHHIDGDHSNNAPENLAPYCKRCHNEHHGIDDNLTELGLLVREYYDIQDQRKRTQNRISAYQKLGYSVPAARKILIDLEELEKRLAEIIGQIVKDEPIYAVYLQHIPGVGPMLAAGIIVETVDPGRFNTISKYWALSGLDVAHDSDGLGYARKRMRGQTANWNPFLRSLFTKKLTDQFIKLGTDSDAFGRQLYDKYKKFYTERDAHRINPKTGKRFTKLHIDNRARRKVGKIFAACLWVVWRKLLGMPVTEPYAARLDGHSHIITPEDWYPYWELQGYQYRLDFPEGLPSIEVDSQLRA